jgi:hypothetical protein
MNRFARDAKIAANVTSRRAPGPDDADSLPHQPVRDYNNASYVFVPLSRPISLAALAWSSCQSQEVDLADKKFQQKCGPAPESRHRPAAAFIQNS